MKKGSWALRCTWTPATLPSPYAPPPFSLSLSLSLSLLLLGGTCWVTPPSLVTPLSYIQVYSSVGYTRSGQSRWTRAVCVTSFCYNRVQGDFSFYGLAAVSRHGVHVPVSTFGWFSSPSHRLSVFQPGQLGRDSVMPCHFETEVAVCNKNNKTTRANKDDKKNKR